MNESQEISATLNATKFEERIKTFFNAAIKIDVPSAIWRLPKSQKINAICQLDANTPAYENIENAPEGFVFHPFQETDEFQKHFIRADVSLEQEKEEFILNPSCTQPQKHFDRFLQAMKEVSNDSKFHFSDYLNKSPAVTSKKEEFLSLVEKCKTSIVEGYYQKIVPSRQSKFKIKKSSHPVNELFKLCERYENAFISLVYIPKVGLWIGASPELLISVKNQNEFETISLAGTQEIPRNFNLAKAMWTQKEIEEQALVSRYIINCFKQIRLREFQEFGPKTVQAGNLIHLKTIFKVNIDEVNFPQLGNVMLKLLHPTSAVCGMPMIPAAKFLAENEKYSRQYFSGYLGPVNIDKDINIYVNLRCARIYSNSGLLFAGAGVTEDSDAESEWNETNIKFQTLLNVFGEK